MAINLVDRSIERSLIRLARRLTENSATPSTPTTKHGVAREILKRAFRDGIEAANAWLHDNGNNGNNVPCGASDPDHDG